MTGQQTKRLILVFFLIAHFFLIKISAQQDSLHIEGKTSAETIVHNGELPPLWMVALNSGRWRNDAGSQSLVTAYAGINWHLNNNWRLTAKAEGNHTTGYSDTYLHTGMIGIQWHNWRLSAGKHVFDPIFTVPNQGSGSYIYGDNYRPVPRITFELSEFTPVPFANTLFEVRGGISHGWLPDQQYGSDVLLHEKYAYLRINLGKWQPYGGLNHSALMGGKRSNGTDIPVDFWATFFGKGSEKIGGGDATNAAGAHMGLYDFGVYLKTSNSAFHFYYQIPFSDGSGSLFWQGNSDHILGVDWKPEKVSWLSNLTIEWVQTTYQSGNGMPDPGIPQNMNDGTFLHYSNLSSEDMLELFGIEKENWTEEEIKDVLKREVNHGNDFGGRDGYMNNGMYPSGWSYKGHIMGSPFNLTRQQLEAVRPDMEFHSIVNIKNDRYKGLHLGAKGNAGTQLTWKTKITWIRNFGTYFEQYPGRYTWEETENYWFKDGRDQWYTMLQFSWIPKDADNLNINLAVAYDGGEIYHSAGLKAGLSYNF